VQVVLYTRSVRLFKRSGNGPLETVLQGHTPHIHVEGLPIWGFLRTWEEPKLGIRYPDDIDYPLFRLLQVGAGRSDRVYTAASVVCHVRSL